MKKLSQWASCHVHVAIFLIILCEVVNGYTGVLLGANVLDRVPLLWLSVGMILLIGVAIFIQRNAAHWSSCTSYWIGRQYLFAAFLSNFLLFILLGGIWSQRLQTVNPSVSVLGNRRLDAVRDTLPPTDSLRSAKRSTGLASGSSTDKPQGDQRAQYALLGVLGIVVAALATSLACTIACSGYGFSALLVFYLGLGSMAGSAYFFNRAAQKPAKRRRDMTADERRRDGRRFWRTWLILIGIFSAIFLLTSSK